MNHTKLPWKLIKHEAYFGDQECWTILDNEGNELMDSEKYYPSVPKSFEIWERIVNSVNTHDQLLEVAKVLYGAMKLSYAGSPGPVRTGILHINPELYSKLEKAIAKAKRKI